ncbi:MAG: NAD(+)/NADH kinase, partial [Candidatus Thermoplasmatota archaeon]|nr:NAD(+)/NADH kinase [Candidatus Thermoplasmatota archaeon]
MKISIVYKKGALNEAEAVKEKAEARGVEVLSTLALNEFSEGGEDIVVVIGGDGSFLRVASIANKPIALLRYESFGFFS